MAISLRMCDVMQYVEYMKCDEVGIVEILEAKGVKDYALILHDKDINKDGEKVKPHYHIALRFDSPRKSDQIAKWFGIEENFVGRVKGRWQDILKYLTHENAPSKYQYPVTDVICNFDYEEGKKTGYGRKEEIITKIASGEIREFNLHKEVNIIDYDKYKRNIENAFLYRQKILSEKSDRIMEVIFMYGKSGTGKSTYAKMIAEDKNYSYFISSGSNDPFDGYAGQDCVILDDLRGSSFKFDDLLKITDNHTSSTVKSRYKNKWLECKLIIITSIMPIEEFYTNVFKDSNDPLEQFERRCKTYVNMQKDKMIVYAFDENKMDYVKAGVAKNPVAQKIAYEKANSLSKRLEVIKDTLCGIEFDETLELEEVKEDNMLDW